MCIEIQYQIITNELDRTIQRIDDQISNDIRNNVDMMDFNEMGKEQLELPPGNYENLFMLNVANLTNTNQERSIEMITLDESSLPNVSISESATQSTRFP